NLANSGTSAVGATAMKAVPFTVNYAANTGTDHYEVHTRCGTVNVGLLTAAQIALPIGCTATPMNIEVIARSSAGVALAWTQQPNVAITSGGSTTIADTWHAPVQLAATYTNPTPQVSDITVARFSPYVRGLPVAEVMSATSATTNVMLNVSQTPSASLSTSLLCPMSATPGCLATPSGTASQRITQAVDGTLATYALDIGANLLPWVKALYVPATTSLDITVTGSGAFDIFEANLQYTRGQTIYVWRVFGPLAQSVTFPTLPATAPGDPTVRTTDVQSSYQAFVGESDAINGYRDAIKNPFEALGTCDATSSTTAKPYPGTTARISQWN
ncbi:MAG TPA: hypothetical protein VFV99_01295, partial [Kofleriaceae bacterium]|nr:hypothetical protein [Kofleriaceae bacterium]